MPPKRHGILDRLTKTSLPTTLTYGRGDCSNNIIVIVLQMSSVRKGQSAVVLSSDGKHTCSNFCEFNTCNCNSSTRDAVQQIKHSICRKVTTNKRQLKTLFISERVSGRKTLQQLILIVPRHPRTTILTGPHLIPSQFYADIFLFQEVSGLCYATFGRKYQKKGLEGDIPVNMWKGLGLKIWK